MHEPQKWWYLAANGQPSGPFSLTHIRNLLAKGHLTSHDLVFQEGTPNWITVTQALALSAGRKSIGACLGIVAGISAMGVLTLFLAFRFPTPIPDPSGGLPSQRPGKDGIPIISKSTDDQCLPQVETPRWSEAEMEKARVLASRIAVRGGGKVLVSRQYPSGLHVHFNSESHYADDLIVEELARVQEIVGLDLGRCSITNRALEHIGSMQHLRELGIVAINSRIDNNGLAYLRNLPSLTLLGVTDCKAISDDGILRIASHPRIQYLSLSNTSVSDVGLRAIAKMKCIKKLFLYETCVTGLGIAALRGLDLEELSLSKKGFENGGVENYLGAIKENHQLDLTLIPIDDQWLECLASQNQLEAIKVNGSGITNRLIETLTRLKRLKRVHLTRTNVTDQGIARLSGLQTIEELRLTGTQITNAALPHISALVNLRRLDLSETGVNDVGLSQLKCPTLECLLMRDTQIRPFSLRALKHLAGLREVDISHWHSLPYVDFQVIEQEAADVSLLLRGTKITAGWRPADGWGADRKW